MYKVRVLFEKNPPACYISHLDLMKALPRALRRAALGQLPESVAKRKKLGFPVPLNDWLRQDKYYHMVRQAFEGEVAAQFFNVPELLRLLDEHKAGKNGGMTKIWSFYSFILWYEQFFVLR